MDFLIEQRAQLSMESRAGAAAQGGRQGKPKAADRA